MGRAKDGSVFFRGWVRFVWKSDESAWDRGKRNRNRQLRGAAKFGKSDCWIADHATLLYCPPERVSKRSEAPGFVMRGLAGEIKLREL